MSTTKEYGSIEDPIEGLALMIFLIPSILDHYCQTIGHLTNRDPEDIRQEILDLRDHKRQASRDAHH